MSTVESPDELVQLLTTRRAVIDAIREGIDEKRVLADVLDVSRSTVDRGVRDLDEAGIASVEGTDFETTAFGALVHDAYTETRAFLADAIGARPILESIPAAERPPPAILGDATVVTATTFSPHRPWTRRASAWKAAERVDMLLPHVTRPQLETVLGWVDPSSTHSLWLPATRREELRSAIPDLLDRVGSSPGILLGTVPAAPPYGLVLESGGATTLLAYRGSGHVRAALATDAPPAREWARSRFREVTGDGTVQRPVRP